MGLRARIAVYLAILGGGTLCGQVPTGTITGTVRDSSGAAVVAATVSIKSAATNGNRDIATDPSGSFRATNLPPGAYDLAVTKAGFRTLRDPGVSVELDRTTEVALVLDVGSVSDSVEVPATAAATDTQVVLDQLFAMAEL